MDELAPPLPDEPKKPRRRCPRVPFRTLFWTVLLWAGIPAMVAQAVVGFAIGSDRLIEYMRDNRLADLPRFRFLQVSFFAAVGGLALLFLFLLVRFRRKIVALAEPAEPTVEGAMVTEPMVEGSTETDWPAPLVPVPPDAPGIVAGEVSADLPAASIAASSADSLDLPAVADPGLTPAPVVDPNAPAPTPAPVVTYGPRPTVRSRLLLAKRIGKALAPLLLAPGVSYLLNWRTFENQPVVLLACIVIAVALFERTVRLAMRPDDRAPGRWARWFSLTPTWQGATALSLLFLTAVGYIAYFVLMNHYRFQTASYDLGIFDNMMWQLWRGEWFRSTPAYGQVNLTHITRHATFIAAFLMPLYLLGQRAETMLVMQTVIALSACIPLYKLAKRRLGSTWLALGFAYSYLVFAPLHGALFYDFHFITLVPAFIAWTVYFFDTRRRWPFIVMGILSLLVREDVGPGLALMAFYFFLSNNRPKAALWGGLVAGAYFFVTKFVVMPLHSSPEDRGTFTYLYQRLIPEGKDGFGAILQTIVLNPMFTLGTILKEEKIIYLLQVLVPVAFLPFRNKKAWLPLMASILFTVFPSDPPLYSICFQYTSHFSSYLFLTAVFAMSDWRRDPAYGRRRIVPAVAAMCLASTLVSFHYGAMFQHHTFKGGFRRVQFEFNESDRAQLREFRALAALVPKHASVVASETEVPHFSNRHRCYTMRFGAQGAEYIFVRLDEVAGGDGPRRHLLEALRTGEYSFVKREGRFALWKKGGDHALDHEGLRHLNVDHL